LEAFIRKCNFEGDEIWIWELGECGRDFVYGLSAVSSGVYVAG